LWAAYAASAAKASLEEDAWYREGSGVPVGWKERAVALRPVPFVPTPLFTAAGDMLRLLKSYVLMVGRFVSGAKNCVEERKEGLKWKEESKGEDFKN
jgi:hypothetical protein